MVFKKQDLIYAKLNKWRNNYFPIEAKYKEGTRKPLTFDKEPEGYDYLGMREKIVQEELDINRIRCPITNINDPTQLYTCSQAKINEIPQEEIKSIFSLNNDQLNIYEGED